MIRAYAGIGSRKITYLERREIRKVAEFLSDWTLYSGHAPGADMEFEKYAADSLIWLPWRGFNGKCNVPWRVAGNTAEGLDAMSMFHPAPWILTPGARALDAYAFDSSQSLCLGRDFEHEKIIWDFVTGGALGGAA